MSKKIRSLWINNKGAFLLALFTLAIAFLVLLVFLKVLNLL